MSNKLQTVRGTKDWFDEDCDKFYYLVDKARSLAENYGCKNMQTPIMEHHEVFVKSLGDSSDVVGKEMYNLTDKGGDILTLRPEFTAAVARAFFANGWQQFLPLRLFTYGPVFRYERPQKARLRQFHQLNVEFLGPKNPMVDVELICCAIDFLKISGLDITDDIKLQLNSLGNPESRKLHKSALKTYLSDYFTELSDDSKRRFETNPLRILDSKDDGDRKIVANAPKLSSFLDQESKEYFANVCATLEYIGINYNLNDNLVRGLDYYQHTIFEFVTDKLGAQGTVLAGGRYDGLYKMMGGTDVDAIGFAMGIERYLELYSVKDNFKHKDTIVIATQNEEFNIFALKLMQELRINKFQAEIPYHKNGLGKKLQHANKINARFAIIIGEDEMAAGFVKVKDLTKSIEHNVAWENLVDFLAKCIF